MKITLISPYPDITAFGIRTISSHLKASNHKVQLIFLPDPFEDDLGNVDKRYNEEMLADLIGLCAASDIIGVTLMTNFFDGAVQITSYLKSKLESPIIWGGVHPTLRPEESLEHADMVCLGEGEDAVLELLNKMESKEDIYSIENIWFKKEGEIIKNPLRPLTVDLDCYPHPDYSMDDHHVLYKNHIVPLDHALTEKFLSKGTVSGYLGKIGYQTMTSRGCPYSCSYCINHTIKTLYGNKGRLRWRSVDDVIAEFENVKKNMPYVNYIWISDDEFLARKQHEIEDFCYKYKERINLPFSILVSPVSVKESKIKLLVDAGLVYVQMGVESASKRMQKIFNRTHIDNALMMNAISIINKFNKHMQPPSYDFLMDVPGETDQDRLESLRFIANIPKPFKLQPFTLIPYPGTQIYEVAKSQGLITDERKEIYNRTYTMREPTYLNLLMSLAKGGNFPSWILKLLISPGSVMVFNSKASRPVFKVIYLSLQFANNFRKKVLS